MKTQFELEDIKAVSSTVVEMITPMLGCSCENNSNDSIFGVKDLAIYLGVKESWVRGKVDDLEIPHFRCGKYIKFKKKDIDKWIDRKMVKPISPLKMAKK